ncbi:MAG TPA: nucleotide disphospho-sugar-binding domain-containing protein [Actinomycetota bacterium]|nr:nucleotide disphospho-sugar-binding domain-containing protein [Actinomycetota bacterium]
MKVLEISGIGSIGDVYPFIGLGVALKARGHRVTIMASGRFRKNAEEAGLEFVRLGPSDEMMLNPLRPKWVREEAMPLVLNDVYRLIEENYDPGRTLVVAALGTIGAAVAGEKLGVPVVYASVSPAYFQKHLDPFLRRAGPAYGMLYEATYRPRTAPDAFRAQLGLPHKSFSEWLEWCRSPGPVMGLFPEWYAPSQARWLAKVSLTEFSLYDAADKWTPPEGLVQFLEQGDPPLVFAPSSWSRLTERAITEGAAACRLLGRRGIFVNVRENEISHRVSSEIGLFGYLPFSWILPRSAAVIHHGGMGTASQALAAGIPQLVIPLHFVQRYDSGILRKLGVALRCRPLRAQAARLARALGELLQSPEIAANCRLFAERMVEQKGMEKACLAVERTAIAGGHQSVE